MAVPYGSRVMERRVGSSKTDQDGESPAQTLSCTEAPAWKAASRNLVPV